MPLKESEAIVLRSFPLGEADRLVSFLGRTTGRLRGVARGARRTKSRFGSTLETLSHIRIWFYERETRELVRINQCELIESFLETQREYETGLALALVSEITEAVLPEREASDAMFRLVLLTARAIAARKSGDFPLAYFNLWTVRLGGWLPGLERCIKCGREVKREPVYLGVGRPGLRCGNCRTPGWRVLSAKALELALTMLRAKLEALNEQEWPKEAAIELNQYFMDVIEHQVERKLTTRQLRDEAE